jgi:hypothetical protein
LSITDIAKGSADSAANLQRESHCLCPQPVELAEFQLQVLQPLEPGFDLPMIADESGEITGDISRARN